MADQHDTVVDCEMGDDDYDSDAESRSQNNNAKVEDEDEHVAQHEVQEMPEDNEAPDNENKASQSERNRSDSMSRQPRPRPIEPMQEIYQQDYEGQYQPHHYGNDLLNAPQHEREAEVEHARDQEHRRRMVTIVVQDIVNILYQVNSPQALDAFIRAFSDGVSAYLGPSIANEVAAQLGRLFGGQFGPHFPRQNPEQVPGQFQRAFLDPYNQQSTQSWAPPISHPYVPPTTQPYSHAAANTSTTQSHFPSIAQQNFPHITQHYAQPSAQPLVQQFVGQYAGQMARSFEGLPAAPGTVPTAPPVTEPSIRATASPRRERVSYLPVARGSRTPLPPSRLAAVPSTPEYPGWPVAGSYARPSIEGQSLRRTTRPAPHSTYQQGLQVAPCLGFQHTPQQPTPHSVFQSAAGPASERASNTAASTVRQLRRDEARLPSGIIITIVPPPKVTRTAKIWQQQATSNYAQHNRGRPKEDLCPPRRMDISMLEILTFGPSWLIIPEVAVRAILNGWTRKALAKAQLNAIDQLTRDNMRTASDRVQKQISEGGKLAYSLPKEDPWNTKEMRSRAGLHHDLTSKNWMQRDMYPQSESAEAKFAHMPLKTIYESVPRANWPRGEDRLQMTKCMEFAADNEHLDLDTSHFEWILKCLGDTPSSDLNASHDTESYKRFERDVPDPPVR